MDNKFVLVKLARPTIKIIFEFSVPKPRPTFYRGVQAVDGSFRMEKRGHNAKHYRAFMWCGSAQGLYQHREAVKNFCGVLNPEIPILPRAM